MGSGKKEGGKIHGNNPGSMQDNLMMIQGIGEMNLDAWDSGDWLMINNENGVRAKNHPQARANQPPKAWAQPGELNQASKSMGQPTMLGQPHVHEHDSWGNFHNPTTGFVPRPPNFVSSNKHDVMVRNPVGPPSWSNSQNFSARGGYDGNEIKSNGGSKRPIVVDSDDDDDDDVEEDEKGYSCSKAKNPTQSKAPIKGVHLSLTINSRGYPGVGPKPYSYPGVGYHGRRPIGEGVMPMPPAHFPPPPFPLPPLRSVGNFPSGDKKRNSDGTSENFPNKVSFEGGDGTKFDDQFDDEFDDDLESEEEEDTHKRGSDQNGRLVGGQVNLDPRLGVPPQLKNSWNSSHGGGGSYINAKKSVVSHGDVKEDPQQCVLSEHYRQSYSNSGSIGATSCKTREKNVEKDVENLSDSGSTDIEGNGESEVNDNPNDEVVARSEFVIGKSVKFGKNVEENFAVKQISKLPEEVEKEVQFGEATDICIGEQLQMKAVSILEDYKKKVKEVAKLVKFQFTPKPEIDTYASEKQQLMKIHEEKLKMKKRHQQEEQELEKQFSVALKRFLEKQTIFNADSEASSEL